MKFQAADVDKSGSLDLSEFAAFTHPYDYEHMYDFEVNMTLKAQDQNKDGVIDFNEYSGEEDGEGGRSIRAGSCWQLKEVCMDITR